MHLNYMYQHNLVDTLCAVIYCISVSKVYICSVSPRINEKGGGDLAGAQSIKLYLGAWCMYILHS